MFEEEFDLMLRHLISDFLLSDIKKDIIINRITNQIVKLTSNSENIKDFKKTKKNQNINSKKLD